MHHTFRIDYVQDWTYYSRLALQRYRISASRLEYLKSDSSFLEQLDEDFIELLIRCFAQPELFAAADYQRFQLSTILEYLRKTHVLYIYKRLPEIAQSIHILKSGYEEPEALLVALDVFFKNYSKHLIEHVDDEEVRLFKYVARLQQAEFSLPLEFVFEEGVLDEFLNEHDDTGFDLRDVRKMLRTFLPNAQNQTPYRMLLERLRNFEVDLRVHSRLEEEVLIPMAMKLEKRLLELYG